MYKERRVLTVIVEHGADRDSVARTNTPGHRVVLVPGTLDLLVLVIPQIGESIWILLSSIDSGTDVTQSDRPVLMLSYLRHKRVRLVRACVEALDSMMLELALELYISCCGSQKDWDENIPSEWNSCRLSRTKQHLLVDERCRAT
jgi:hypothetical protein